ncbi:MAG: hypothetical protein ABR511_14130 [Acidimicrobiales bacterium]
MTCAPLRRLLLAAMAVALLLSACGTDKEVAKVENVKPPAAGTPAGPSDVSGIYRTIHTATLQLRKDGTMALVVPGGSGASSGRFTLQDGRVELQTTPCHDAIGSYDLTVTGLQKAGKAALVWKPVNDPCADRLRDLTRDPWVYADS